MSALALRCLLLTIPLIIGLAWGTAVDDSAYVAFRCARNLASGRGLTYDAPLSGGLSAFAGLQSARSPLYVLALWLPAALGISLTQAGLILSLLGWGAAALAIHRLGQAAQRPVAAIVSAALLALSPAFIPALGTEIPWVVALALLAAAMTASERWRPQTGAIVLMLCLRLEPSTLATAALLMSIRWIERRRFPLGPVLGMAIVVLTWGILVRLGITALPLAFSLDLSGWTRAIASLLHESELYWLYLPAIGAGIVSLRACSRILWIGVPWIAILATSTDMVAPVMELSLGVLLAGMGIGVLARTIQDRAQPRRLVSAVGLAFVFVFPLAFAQASSLWHRYRSRPVARQALEGQAAGWLRAHSEPTAIVLGSARVGFLSDRATYPWDGDSSDTAAYAALVEALSRRPPDYCVSDRGLGWDRLMRTAWFQDDYASSQRFFSPSEAVSPLTIWRYGPLSKPQTVDAMFGDRIRLLSVWTADRVAPGEDLVARLDWTALGTVDQEYIVFVHMLDANGDRIASHDGVPRDKKSPTHTWFPGYVVPDVHRFPVPADTPAGTYALWAGMYTWPDLVRLPVQDRAGVEQVNQTLFLRSVEVGPTGN
jgi:hypothetical protein